MSAPVDTLLRILDLEASRGYDDRAVIGGLSAYLRGSAAGLARTASDRALLAELQKLCAAGFAYSKWDRETRRRWASRLTVCLRHPSDKPKATSPEKALTSSPGPAPSTGAGKGAEPLCNLGAAAGMDSPVTALHGVGPAVASKLEKLGATTVRDLLYLFPRRHIDYSKTRHISDLAPGEEQTIIANVWQAGVTQFGRMKGVEAVVGDETGNIRVVWFNQPWIAARLAEKARVAISGRVDIFRGELRFESPEWDLVEEHDLVHAGRLVPVYPLTRGLYPRLMRNLMKRVVDGWAWQEREFLPAEVTERRKLMGLVEALRQSHFPDSPESCARARERLAFDELLVLQLGVLDRKREWQEGGEGRALSLASGIVERFMGGLPFGLTEGQKQAANDILSDLARARPMSRLLQGDVGSGKTVVATAALVAAVDSGYQGALMAPTQVLAEQHFKTMTRLLPPAEVSEEDGIRFYPGLLPRPLSIALLTGSTSERKRGLIYQRIKAGEVDLVIGTHALIQKDVEFARLALVVVDEQHRFGVMQRAALRQKGFNPHLLVMTATPIPRTLALTLFGDLDISTINQMPPGRQRVKTRWIWPEQRSKAYAFLREQAKRGYQAFVICPLVEESDVVEAKAAVSEFERLSNEVFPDLRLGLLHGRMKGNEKEEVMRRFSAGEFDILVSTAVVEVGIDVPNATVMLVEGADRFGLSQLHQFRGRVGRGEAQSYCILLSDNPSPEGRERLALIERTYDGFLLAEEDMKLRGPGEFFGTRQSGMPDLHMARLSDAAILERAREEALRLFQQDPELESPQNALLRARVARAWKRETEVS